MISAPEFPPESAGRVQVWSWRVCSGAIASSAVTSRTTQPGQQVRTIRARDRHADSFATKAQTIV
jgi:hypothetical protein